MDSNSLIASLGKVGKLFYDTMIGKLNSGNYPPGSDNKRNFTTIQDATSVQSPIEEEGKHSVSITINLRQAPFAAAYEWGSGEHGEKGSTYEIVPRYAPHMRFFLDDWPGWDDWDGGGARPSKAGIFSLVHVNHPGVEKKPYILPTIVETREEIKKILGQDFKTYILTSLRETEV